MIVIRGSVFDALWRTDPVDIPTPAPPQVGPQWGLDELGFSLAPLSRGEVVLITGGSGSGKSSLARTIALASAEVGYHVDVALSSSVDEEAESHRFVSAAIVDSLDKTETEPIPGEALPIGHIDGQVRIYEGRPALLSHEQYDGPLPHILICDFIDNYVGLGSTDLGRAVVLAKLREYAMRNTCLVLAISDEEEATAVDLLEHPRVWERHVGKHLHLERFSPEVCIHVVKDDDEWPGEVVEVADQTKIGRLGNLVLPAFENPDQLSLEWENLSADGNVDDPKGGVTERFFDVDLEELRDNIADELAYQLRSRPEEALRFLRLTQTMTLLGEDFEQLVFTVQNVIWRERITMDSVLDFGDGVNHLCQDVVDADVIIKGDRINIIVTLSGAVTYSLGDKGQFFDLGITDLLSLAPQ